MYEVYFFFFFYYIRFSMKWLIEEMSLHMYVGGSKSGWFPIIRCLSFENGRGAVLCKMRNTFFMVSCRSYRF